MAIVIDDVSLIQPGQALANLDNIERIEVLRGPQSVLFGKNAAAGLINIITKRPSDELKGSIEAMTSDDDEKGIKLSLSGPISDAVSYSLSGYYKEYGGHIDNLTDGSTLDGSEDEGVRGKIYWQATDA